jgi:16S rRNA G966 N2-methylase RsmD
MTVIIKKNLNFSTLLMPLTDNERNGLEQSILAEGCHTPLVVWNGVLVDGHNRYSICIRHGLSFDVREVEFANEQAATNWIIDNQLSRRNLTVEQTWYLRAKRYEAKKKPHGGDRGNQYAPKLPSCNNYNLAKTEDEIAKEYNVSPRTIHNNVQYAKNIDIIATSLGEDTKNKILNREVRVTQKDVGKLAKIVENNPEQGQAVFYAIKTGKAKSVNKAKSFVHPAPPKKDSRVTNGTNIVLLEGDCFDKLASVANTSISLVVTDPPYNVTNYEWDKIGSDKDFLLFTCRWLKAIQAKLKEKYHLFFFCDAEYSSSVEMLLREMEMPLKSRVIWNYRNLVKGRDVKDKFIQNWQMIFHIGTHDLRWPLNWDERRFAVQTHATPQSNFEEGKYHPHQKPLSLIKLFVELGSAPEDIVLDLFAGSGTTGVACNDIGRACILIEQSIEYAEIIRQRVWIN